MEILAIFLPGLAALIVGLFGRALGDRGSQIVTCGAMTVSAVLAVILLFQYAGTHESHAEEHVIHLLNWIKSGDLELAWALRFDTLTAVMVFVVNLVSCLVHYYSVGYMSHDPSKPRFMAYLSLFTFAMLMLVTADNLIQLFFGWEGVGLASYLLIGFWHHKDSANQASMKAFVVNRVGDFGFLLGILTIFVIFGTVQFSELLDPVVIADKAGAVFTFFGYQGHALTIACLLLFVGAMGKSAQLGLHTWLPDAMEGPTPVSALIHAATMVTAGVFMLSRLSPIFEYAPDALMVVAVLGACTAFVAATIGLTQFDIKRVIAYSTMSQLGYMFFALGVSAYSAAIFHLMTHAFFKALLFLGAGSVIHAMSDEQDMRQMGGIWKKIPFTYAMMWIGSLALAGIPLFAGYYSKDMVLEAAWADHTGIGEFAYWMGIAAAIMTAFYSWRLIIMTFHGKPRASEDVMSHVHESPLVMTIPLAILAVGAVFAGFIGYEYFVGHDREAFWGASIFVLAVNDTIEAAHHVPAWVKKAPLVAAVLGIAFAYLFYMFKPGLPARVVGLIKPIHTFVFRKWMFDELYNKVFVSGSMQLGKGFWKNGDGAVIDGLGPNGMASLSKRIAGRFSQIQTGYVYHYAFAMLVGVIALVAWYLSRQAG
ncbi:MAG: NADH-quinone oxidoreductase subunit L [Alphaproteobacteria bacterium]|nr:NADH-quinone oxidoreductase subunit L [Alphaproteobacteria bacterium]MAS46083.1 NADH-quinone oxidoreductase subunit L [Alphaproteobacteria bacterium]MAX95734.1 NADH-quinone oxidoreductase subunit L [Alphaproteobacteria bacterium]MBN54131.1 NADH-quinone oxidoreductase subunit L [Alphaproteobacteria bacterium]OUT42284.1 MAG: NADH-quinone oxidoreductase subunit L [Micavibrio sp. TMED2]|tara:strand:- start:649 stop:2598 length:1950 start_codon:yes stop_codon:yes gene_type:complete